MTMIAISLISDPTWNSRLSLIDKETKELAASMQARIDQGKPPLINPILVEKTTDGYELVAGSRRLAAAKVIKLEEIQATVETFKSGADKVLDNIVENLLRKNLTTFEEARACYTLREAGLKLREVKDRTGLSESHVSKLVTAYAGLHPDIKTKWQAKSPVATTDFLAEIVKLDADEQVKVFNSKEAAYASYANDGEDEEDSDKPKKKPAKVKRAFTVKVEDYQQLHAWLSKAKPDMVSREMMVKAIEYLVGETSAIRIPGQPPFPPLETVGKAGAPAPKEKKKSTKKKG